MTPRIIQSAQALKATVCTQTHPLDRLQPVLPVVGTASFSHTSMSPKMRGTLMVMNRHRLPTHLKPIVVKKSVEAELNLFWTLRKKLDDTPKRCRKLTKVTTWNPAIQLAKLSDTSKSNQ